MSDAKGSAILGGALIVASFIPGVNALAGVLLPAGLSMLSGAAASALQKPPKLALRGIDFSENVTDPMGRLPVVYGQAKLGVHRIFAETTHDETYMWVVCAICHGEIEAIDSIWLDGNAAIGADGRVISPIVSLGIPTLSTQPTTLVDYRGYVAAAYALGTTSQTAAVPKITGAATTVTEIKGQGDGTDVKVTTSGANAYQPGDSIKFSGLTGPGGLQNILVRLRHELENNWWGVTERISTTQFRISKRYGHTQVIATGGTCNFDAVDMAASFPGRWGAGYNGKGVAYVVLRLKFHPERFPTGVPNIEVVVRGRKVFDPRDSTTLYKTNPVLAVRDYLTNPIYGLGLAASEVHDTAFISEANYCDEAVTPPVGETGVRYRGAPILATHPAGGATLVVCASAHPFTNGLSVELFGTAIGALNAIHTITVVDTVSFTVPVATTQSGSGGTCVATNALARYTANGILRTEQSVKQNLDHLLTACRGNLVYEGGVYRPWIRKPGVPVLHLTEDHILKGSWSFAVAGHQQIVNTIRAAYPNRARGWQVDYADFPPPGIANGFLVEDNNYELFREIDLPYTDLRATTQQILQTIRRETRRGITAGFLGKEVALQLTVGDLIEITHPTPGWVAKDFWVSGLLPRMGGVVRLLISEYEATAYDLQATDATPLDSSTTLPNPFFVFPPVGVQATTDLETGRVQLTWEPSKDAFLAGYEVQYKKTLNPDGTPNEDWSASSDVGNVDRHFIAALEVLTASYDFRVRAYNHVKATSQWAELLGYTLGPRPNPTFALFGEGTAEGLADYGNAILDVTFDANTDRVHIYSAEAEASPVPMFEIHSNLRLSAIIERPEGDVGKEPNWFTQWDMATFPGWRRAVRCYGVKGKATSPPFTAEVQAVDTGTGPAGVPSNLSISQSGASFNVQWLNGDAAAETRVFRNGIMVKKVAAGVAAWVDAGLDPLVSYSYRLQHIRDHQTSAFNGLGSGTGTIGAPLLGLPLELKAVFFTLVGPDVVILSWRNPNPESVTRIERSPDGSVWSPLIVAPVGARSFVDRTGHAGDLYRFQSEKAGFTSSGFTTPIAAT